MGVLQSPRPVNPDHGRKPESIDEEIQFLKDKIERVVCKGSTDETMLGRISKFFRAADIDRKKYLTTYEFINVLGEGACHGWEGHDR